MTSINLLTSIPGPKSIEIIERRKNAMPAGLAKSTEIAIASAKGGIVTDVDGNILLDFAGGIGMMNIGHRNENVVNAMKEQLDKYIHICSLVATPEPYVELAELLKEHKDLKKIPLIFLSAQAEQSDFDRAREVGADDYIKKPFDIEKLKIRIRELLSGAK